MRRCPALLFALGLLGGCLQTGFGTGTGTGGAGQGASDASADSSRDGGASPEQTGSACLQDPQSGVVLCEQINLCPGVVVDPGLYPNCGFRPNAGSTLDLECMCGQSLCPIGVAASCASAEQLLEAQSSLVVCLQENEGRCVSLPAGGTSGSGAASPCPPAGQTCAEQCGGTPACFQACGC
jgi:hypothetical protein